MKKVNFVLGALIFLNAIFWHADVYADNDNLVLSVGLKEEYLDNIFFDSDDKIDDYITTLSTGIELRKRTERLKAGLKGLFDAVVYVDNNDLNNLDQYYKGYAEYFVTERLSVTGNASYKYDSRADRDVVETGLLLGTNVRKSQRYDGRIWYELSELSTVTLGYIYRKEAYDNREYDNDDVHSASALWRHDLGYWLPGVKSRVGFNYSRFNYQFTMTDNYSATVGGEKEISELYKFYFDIGGRYTHYEAHNDDEFAEEDKTGGLLKAGLKYMGEYVYTNMFILHDITAASGRGRTLERTSFVGSLRYRITEKLNSGLNGGYYWNRGDISVDPFDKHTIRVVPYLTYQFTNNMRVKAAYTYTRIDSDKKNGDSDRNDFYIGLNFRHNFFD